MKKIIALALALILCLALAACGQAEPEPQETPTPEPAEAVSATAPPAEEPAEEPVEDPAEESGGESDALAATVELVRSLIGQPVQELYDAVGQPLSSDYASSCLVSGGEDGILTYDGFTVHTLRVDGEGDRV